MGAYGIIWFCYQEKQQHVIAVTRAEYPTLFAVCALLTLFISSHPMLKPYIFKLIFG